MLHVFVARYRDEIIRRCIAKVEARSVGPAAQTEIEHGVPRFLDQLVDALQDTTASSPQIGASAAIDARDLRLQGLTVSQLVHDYGDVCQSITDLAVDLGEPISVTDFRTLNRCLDDAIASAVTEFGCEQAPEVASSEPVHNHERFGFFEHELRNLIGTATVAFEVLKTGNVGVGGSTGGVLERSLTGLRDLVNRSLKEVRLGHDVRNRSSVLVADFIRELTPAAEMAAQARGLRLTVKPGEAGVMVEADRQILTTVVANLLQNAFKFTRPHTMVTLAVTTVADRVLIEIADECGGLPDGNVGELFQPFEQRSADRTGLGLGLAISRWGTEVNNGRISTRNVPGHGCVFAVDLPRLEVSSSGDMTLSVEASSSVRIGLSGQARSSGRAPSPAKIRQA